MSTTSIITPYAFQGQQYLVKMSSTNCCLELIVTDKQSGEEWECSYDTSYIENLTRKTGNFKQFDIFIAMLKNGLLKTSDSITLDLLTYEDLELLRARKLKSQSASRLLAANCNRRYLIVTYTVEFDRINYPLPLEYSGPPDPVILQGTIRRLESELQKTHEKLELRGQSNEKQHIKVLQKRIEELVTENHYLKSEIKQLSKLADKKTKPQINALQKTIAQLERNVLYERSSHHRLVEKLQNDKMHLANQLEKVKSSEKSLRSKLQTTNSKLPVHFFDARTKKVTSSKSLAPIRQTRKSQETKKPNQKQRSRSASPRIIYNNSQWQRSPKTARSASATVKSRSRSSSTSSTRHSGQEFHLDLPLSSGHNSEDSLKQSKSKNQSLYFSSSASSVQNNTDISLHKFGKINPTNSRKSADVIKLEARVRKLFHNKNF